MFYLCAIKHRTSVRSVCKQSGFTQRIQFINDAEAFSRRLCEGKTWAEAAEVLFSLPHSNKTNASAPVCEFRVSQRIYDRSSDGDILQFMNVRDTFHVLYTWRNKTETGLLILTRIKLSDKTDSCGVTKFRFLISSWLTGSTNKDTSLRVEHADVKHASFREEIDSGAN